MVNSEALASVVLFANAFISAGYVVLVVVCLFRIYFADDLPVMSEGEKRFVVLILLVMFLMSAVDRTMNVFLGGVNAYLLTTKTDGPLWAAMVVALARLALGLSVWRLVLYVINSWNPKRTE